MRVEVCCVTDGEGLREGQDPAETGQLMGRPPRVQVDTQASRPWRFKWNSSAARMKQLKPLEQAVPCPLVTVVSTEFSSSWGS